MTKIILVFTLITTIHYSHSMSKRKTVCEKIQFDIIKTTTNLEKIYKESRKAFVTSHKASYADYSKDYAFMSKASAAGKKANANVSKLIMNMIKHKCFKDSPHCIKSLKDLSKNCATRSKASADYRKVYTKISKAYATMSKNDMPGIVEKNPVTDFKWAAFKKAQKATHKASADLRKISKTYKKAFKNKYHIANSIEKYCSKDTLKIADILKLWF